VVRLGAAACKDDLARRSADQTGYGVAGVFNSASRRLAFFMNARSVTVYVCQRLAECLEHCRMDWRRSVVVKVDAHHLSLSGTSMKPILTLLAVLALAVPNIVAQTNNPPDTPKAAADQTPPARQDAGIRK